MVSIDFQIAGGFDCQVYAAVLAQMCDHVVEKADAAVYFVLADAVKVKLDGHVGFLCLPVNLGCSVVHNSVLL